jgi:cysteinyl-tRNA synthetase
MIRLFDTAQGAVAPLRPRRDGEVSMYVCGPTVYGPPHLGHGRFALVFDVLRRYLEWTGADVTYVSNITDIDDKIIERGRSEERDPAEIAVRCERVWWDAMDRIGVKPPTHTPHATAYVDGMVELVASLVERGAAYETADGVYLDTSAVPGYGLLARQSLASLQAGARVEVDEAKRSPTDFVLWKKRAGTGEPTWPSPWGDGRPGWHTECVVMSLDLLGEGFDLHGGGQDLAFPHHENERAQAVALGRSFAGHWVHNGFVEVGGEKMSKSLGNFTNLLDLTDRHDPRAYRLLVLRSHYRSPVEVTAGTVTDAERQLDRLDAFARRTAGLPSVPPEPAALAEFRRLMDDDLNTPGALAVVSQLVTRANQALDIEDEEGAAPLAAAVRDLCGAVGLVLHGEDAEGPDAEAQALVVRRTEAKAARDFASADLLRDELRARGWLVEDTPKGPVLRRV